jgi:hypothetical protein
MFTVLKKSGEPNVDVMINCGTEIGFPDILLLMFLPFEEKIRRYKSNWLRHVTRMNNMTPKIMLNYRSNGLRRFVRPLKRLLDEAGTGLSKPNS